MELAKRKPIRINCEHQKAFFFKTKIELESWSSTKYQSIDDDWDVQHLD